MQAVCALIIVLGIIATISAKSAIGVLFALVVCALAVIVLLFLAFTPPQKKTSAKRNGKSSGNRANSSYKSTAHGQERAPASSNRRAGFRRPIIDIPLDGEVRGDGKKVRLLRRRKKLPMQTYPPYKVQNTSRSR